MKINPLTSQKINKKNNPNFKGSVTQTVGKGISNALESTATKDGFFPKLFRSTVKNIDPTGGNNGFLGLLTIMTCFVIIPRIATAKKRNPDNKEATKDEIKEILCRDIPTVTICLFALKSLNSVVAGAASKATGLPMTNKPYLSVFEQNDLKGFAKVKDRFKQLGQNPLNKLKKIGRNVVDTLNPVGGVVANVNEVFSSKYSGFADTRQIQTMFEGVKAEQGKPDKLFGKVADELIRQQKTDISRAMANGSVDLSHLSDMNNKLHLLEQLKVDGYEKLAEPRNSAVNNLFVNYFKNPDNSLVMGGKKLNAWLRTGALAFEAAFLGFGLPALNQKRLEKKYLNKGPKPLPPCDTFSPKVIKGATKSELDIYKNFMRQK